jgi:hypothetical protein
MPVLCQRVLVQAGLGRVAAPEALPPSTARAQLAGGRLFVPGASDLLELDLRMGATLESRRLEPLRGLQVADEALFVLAERSFSLIAR